MTECSQNSLFTPAFTPDFKMAPDATTQWSPSSTSASTLANAPMLTPTPNRASGLTFASG